MKKIIYCLSSIFILFTSCVQDEKDLFDDPSSIRIQKTLEECQDFLLSAENGWLLEYYMNTKYYGGHFINIDIHKDYGVTLRAEEVLTKRVQEYMGSDIEEATSTYALKKDDGPVFSFDTYNPFIHFFAEPLDDGNGYRGDYEFLIVEATSEKIILKGKKRKDYSFLYKVPAEMTGVEYREARLKNESLLFPEGITTYWYIIEGTDTLYIEGLDRYFQTSEDPYFDNYKTLGAAPTLDGIHFSPAIEFKSNKYDYFNFSEDKNTLISQKNENIKIISISLIDFFNKETNWRNNAWVIDGDNLAGEFATAYQQVVTGVDERYGQVFNHFALKHLENRDRDNRVVYFSSGVNGGNFDIQTSINSDNEFSIKYLGTQDATARLYANRIPAFDTFIETLEKNSPYIISATQSLLTPSKVRLTSKSNPNNWFNVELQ